MSDHSAAEALSKLDINDSHDTSGTSDHTMNAPFTIAIRDSTTKANHETATSFEATTISAITTKDSDASTSNAITNINPQNDCPIFRLPRELRDIIYDYAFHPTKKRASRISLWGVENRAPSPSIVLTCRRIHNETVQLQQPSLEAFWTTNTFTISTYQGRETRQRPNFKLPKLEKYTITPKQVEHMTHISIHICFMCPAYTRTIKDSIELFSEPGSGAWDRTFEDGITSPWFQAHRQSWEYKRCLSDKHLLLKNLLEMLHVWATEMARKRDYGDDSWLM